MSIVSLTENVASRIDPGMMRSGALSVEPSSTQANG